MVMRRLRWRPKNQSRAEGDEGAKKLKIRILNTSEASTNTASTNTETTGTKSSQGKSVKDDGENGDSALSKVSKMNESKLNEKPSRKRLFKINFLGIRPTESTGAKKGAQTSHTTNGDEDYLVPFPFCNSMSLDVGDRPVKVTVKTEAYKAEDIWTACKVGDEAFVRGVIKYSPHIVNSPLDGRTPLYYASHRGHLNIVKRLLEAGATDTDGSAHLAALNDACRRLLKQYGPSFLQKQEKKSETEIDRVYTDADDENGSQTLDTRGKSMSSERLSSLPPVSPFTPTLPESPVQKRPSYGKPPRHPTSPRSKTSKPSQINAEEEPESTSQSFEDESNTSTSKEEQSPNPKVLEPQLSSSLDQVSGNVERELSVKYEPKGGLKVKGEPKQEFKVKDVPKEMLSDAGVNNDQKQNRLGRVANLLREAVSSYSNDWEIETHDSYFDPNIKFEITNITSIKSGELEQVKSSYESFNINRSVEDDDSSSSSQPLRPRRRIQNRRKLAINEEEFSTSTTDSESYGITVIRTHTDGDSFSQDASCSYAIAPTFEEYIISLCFGPISGHHF